MNDNDKIASDAFDLLEGRSYIVLFWACLAGAACAAAWVLL